VADSQDVPRSPHTCRHQHREKREGDEIMDGKGNVIAHHIRCRDCGIILGTWRKGEDE
jgi:hypothetical protein